MSTDSEKELSISSDSWLYPTTTETKSSPEHNLEEIPWTKPSEPRQSWEDASDTSSESGESTTANQFKNYWKRSHSTSRLVSRSSASRLDAGQEMQDSNIFEKKMPVKNPVREHKENPAQPTNWGLYKSKQEEWKNDVHSTTHPQTTYHESFGWPKETSKSTKVEENVDERKLAQAIPPEVAKNLKLGEKQLTDKNWNMRGNPSEFLPIAWSPPEPRSPNDLAVTAVRRPESDRLQEVKDRLERMNYEIQHPVEKWAANLYLH